MHSPRAQMRRQGASLEKSRLISACSLVQIWGVLVIVMAREIPGTGSSGFAERQRALRSAPAFLGFGPLQEIARAIGRGATSLVSKGPPWVFCKYSL